MRTALLTLLLAFSTMSFAAAPCTPKVDHRKLDQIKFQNIQKDKVNSGKEMWRLDAKEVAARECSELVKVEFKPGPISVRGDDKTQVFACGPNGKAHYEITLKKPEWLLPYSGIYKMMMWVVTDVKTVCPAK